MRNCRCEYYESGTGGGCRGKEDVLERSTVATGSISSLGGLQKDDEKMPVPESEQKNLSAGGEALVGWY